MAAADMQFGLFKETNLIDNANHRGRNRYTPATVVRRWQLFKLSAAVAGFAWRVGTLAPDAPGERTPDFKSWLAGPAGGVSTRQALLATPGESYPPAGG